MCQLTNNPITNPIWYGSKQGNNLIMHHVPLLNFKQTCPFHKMVFSSRSRSKSQISLMGYYIKQVVKRFSTAPLERQWAPQLQYTVRVSLIVARLPDAHTQKPFIGQPKPKLTFVERSHASLLTSHPAFFTNHARSHASRLFCTRTKLKSRWMK